LNQYTWLIVTIGGECLSLLCWNGILNVSACDKSTGKENKITITNDKGRLTEEQIERMVKDAEMAMDEDRRVLERVNAKNAFDAYMHSMRSTTDGGVGGSREGLNEKMESAEKETILSALEEGQQWLDSNPEADAEEIRDKQKEIESICAPIVTKYYGSSAGASASAQEEEEQQDFDEL